MTASLVVRLLRLEWAGRRCAGGTAPGRRRQSIGARTRPSTRPASSRLRLLDQLPRHLRRGRPPPGQRALSLMSNRSECRGGQSSAPGSLIPNQEVGGGHALREEGEVLTAHEALVAPQHDHASPRATAGLHRQVGKTVIADEWGVPGRRRSSAEPPMESSTPWTMRSAPATMASLRSPRKNRIVPP